MAPKLVQREQQKFPFQALRMAHPLDQQVQKVQEDCLATFKGI